MSRCLGHPLSLSLSLSLSPIIPPFPPPPFPPSFVSLLSPFHRTAILRIRPLKRTEEDARASILIYHSWLNTRRIRVCIHAGLEVSRWSSTSCPDGNLSNHGGKAKQTPRGGWERLKRWLRSTKGSTFKSLWLFSLHAWLSYRKMCPQTGRSPRISPPPCSTYTSIPAIFFFHSPE